MSMRKIKNAVNNTTGELIYFKGHAKATFMSDGSTVEDAINNIESKIDLSDYVKSEELEGYAKTEDIPSLEGYAKTEDIPSVDGFVQSEDLPNFDEFAKTEDIPSLNGYATEEWVNNKNYATEYDLKNIDYSSINNVPVSEDETGELNITDESGNIGMKVASEAVYAKDFVAGEHKLSEKVDTTKLATINGQSLINGGDINVNGAANVFVWNWDESEDGTVSQDEYDAIKNSDYIIVRSNDDVGQTNSGLFQIDKYQDYVDIINNIGRGTVMTEIVCRIHKNLTYSIMSAVSYPIPTSTSQLTNDSGFITINDIPQDKKEIVEISPSSDGVLYLDDIQPNKTYVSRTFVEGVTFTPSSFNYLPTGLADEYLIFFTTPDLEILSPSIFGKDVLWANGVKPDILPNTTYELSVVTTITEGGRKYKATLTPFKPLE